MRRPKAEPKTKNGEAEADAVVRKSNKPTVEGMGKTVILWVPPESSVVLGDFKDSDRPAKGRKLSRKSVVAKMGVRITKKKGPGRSPSGKSKRR